MNRCSNVGSQNNNRVPDINTGYPGFAYNFDDASQTCDVQLAIETLFIGMKVPYSLQKKQRLQKVPVQFIQGGGWSLTHPVPDGTPVYVHFAQRGISHWLVEGKDSAGMINGKPAPAFSQLFNINAATCTIGNQPIPQAIKGFNSKVAEFRNEDRSQRVTLVGGGLIEVVSGSTYIHIKDGEVEVSTQKTTVKSPEIILDGNVTVTKKLTVNGGAAISGGSGQTFEVTGNVAHNGSYVLNGVKVDGHVHPNPEGGKVGPMESA